MRYNLHWAAAVSIVHDAVVQEESFAAFANDAGRADAAVAGVVSREYVRTQRDAGRRGQCCRFEDGMCAVMCASFACHVKLLTVCPCHDLDMQTRLVSECALAFGQAERYVGTRDKGACTAPGSSAIVQEHVVKSITLLKILKIAPRSKANLVASGHDQ
jgi:hypothetical protein